MSLTVSAARRNRSCRPRPWVCPTRRQFAARKQVPATWLTSTKLSTSHGRYPYRAAKSSGSRARRQAQHAGGQVAAVHARADQEPAEAHHPVQVRAPLGHVPADPAVPGGELQRRRPKPQPAQPAVLRADQVPELPPHQGARPARVLPAHQLVPEPQSARRVVTSSRRRPCTSPTSAGTASGAGTGAPSRRGALGPVLVRARRQGDAARGLQLPQRLQAAPALRGPAGIVEPELRHRAPPPPPCGAGTPCDRAAYEHGRWPATACA